MEGVKMPVSRRDPAVDWLKTAAIFGVMVIHVSAGGLAAPFGSADWVWSLFWDCAFRGSVPLFLMCSGALLLSPERDLPLRKLYTKNLLRLLAALLVWAMAYKLVGLVQAGGLTASAVLQAGKEVVVFRHESHLYYLHIMLLVYAFLPLTRLVVRDRTAARYALALWALLGILYPTVKPYWPFTLLRGIPVQWMMNMAYAAIGYTILGHLLRRHPPKKVYSVIALLSGLALTFGGTLVGSLGAGKLYEHWMEGMSLGPCLLAAGVYGLGVSLVRKPCVVAEQISRASFCVFLVHIFFLHFFADKGVTALAGPAAVTVPLLSLVLLACGCGVYALLRQIPVVRSWLI